MSTADFADLVDQGVFGFSFGWGAIEPVAAQAAEEAGLYVEVFTILDPDSMLWVVQQGADAIETDFPAVLHSLDLASRSRAETGLRERLH
jgi:glycerophosphoryl diester phosphodiesterase